VSRQISMVLSHGAWDELQRIVAERLRDEPHRKRHGTPGRVARGFLEFKLWELSALRELDVAKRREAAERRRTGQEPKGAR